MLDSNILRKEKSKTKSSFLNSHDSKKKKIEIDKRYTIKSFIYSTNLYKVYKGIDLPKGKFVTIYIKPVRWGKILGYEIKSILQKDKGKSQRKNCSNYPRDLNNSDRKVYVWCWDSWKVWTIPWPYHAVLQNQNIEKNLLYLSLSNGIF